MDISLREVGGWLVWAILLGPLLWYRIQRDQRQKREWREWAADIYSNARIESANPIYAFNPETSEVIHDEEEFLSTEGKLIAYALTRISRNAAGEYFWFRIDTGATPPMMSKRMDYSIAKVLLKERFILPSHVQHLS